MLEDCIVFTCWSRLLAVRRKFRTILLFHLIFVSVNPTTSNCWVLMLSQIFCHEKKLSLLSRLCIFWKAMRNMCFGLFSCGKWPHQESVMSVLGVCDAWSCKYSLMWWYVWLFSFVIRRILGELLRCVDWVDSESFANLLSLGRRGFFVQFAAECFASS